MSSLFLLFSERFTSAVYSWHKGLNEDCATNISSKNISRQYIMRSFNKGKGTYSDMNHSQLIAKTQSGERLNLNEGTALFELDLLTLGTLAEQRKRRFHPEPVVTFIIDRNITFTNVCVCACEFCAFYEKPGSEKAFTLSLEQILAKVDELVQLGGTSIMLQGGLNPVLSLDFYETLLRTIKAHAPLHIHSLSVAEIVFLAKKEKLPVRDVIARLQAAGLDSLPGAAEILVDRVRQIISPAKIKTEQWLDVMRTAHDLGMHTTATMTFGIVETLAERVEHMLRVRELQDETGGFKAFIPWTFSPARTKLDHLPMAGGIDYLKTLAIARIMLDNIPHIHAGWVTEGVKIAQLALAFGANDLGGTLMEEVVVTATGVKHETNVQEIIQVIRSAGMIPAQRNSKYDILRYF